MQPPKPSACQPGQPEKVGWGRLEFGLCCMFQTSSASSIQLQRGERFAVSLLHPESVQHCSCPGRTTRSISLEKLSSGKPRSLKITTSDQRTPPAPTEPETPHRCSTPHAVPHSPTSGEQNACLKKKTTPSREKDRARLPTRTPHQTARPRPMSPLAPP